MKREETTITDKREQLKVNGEQNKRNDNLIREE